MTVERELQDWLADRARQRRTRRAIDDYRPRLEPRRPFTGASTGRSPPCPRRPPRRSPMRSAPCSPTMRWVDDPDRRPRRAAARRPLLRAALPHDQQRHPQRPARLRGRAGVDRRRRHRASPSSPPRRARSAAPTSVGFTGQVERDQVRQGRRRPPLLLGGAADHRRLHRRRGGPMPAHRRARARRRRDPRRSTAAARAIVIEQARANLVLLQADDHARPGAAQRRI